MNKKFLIIFLLSFPEVLSGQNADIRILRHINSSQPLAIDGFSRFISNSEAITGIGIPVGMATAGLIKKDKELFRNACVTLAAEAITSGISTALKYSVNRERPFITYTDINQKISVNDPSFPSGHTSNAFATATSVSLEYPEWYVIAPSFAWAGTVAWSRMELGVHYPSDVLAGALIGAGCAWVTHAVNRKLLQNHKNK